MDNAAPGDRVLVFHLNCEGTVRYVGPGLLLEIMRCGGFYFYHNIILGKFVIVSQKFNFHSRENLPQKFSQFFPGSILVFFSRLVFLTFYCRAESWCRHFTLPNVSNFKLAKKKGINVLISYFITNLYFPSTKLWFDLKTTANKASRVLCLDIHEYNIMNVFNIL